MDAEQEDFFEWKSSLLNDEASKKKILEFSSEEKPVLEPSKFCIPRTQTASPVESDNFTVLDLMKSLRLGKGVRKCQVPKYTDKTWHLPRPQTVKEIQKQRDVEEEQGRLDEVRTRLTARLDDIAGRWRIVEEGQKRLKQNLVTYNNFVREKKGKVAENISKRMGEKRRQVDRKRTIKR